MTANQDEINQVDRDGHDTSKLREVRVETRDYLDTAAALGR
jgi:hypothetical protein